MRVRSTIAGVVASILVVGVIALSPSTSAAAPPKARRSDDRPFGAGSLVPSFGFGASINSRVSQVAFGGGARYFPLPGLGVGLSFSNAFTIYGDGFASAYPGIRSRSPTWEGDLLPSLLVVPYRSRWFSPYVLGGVGPRFVNHGKPTLAVWQAGAGAFIGLGGPVFLDLGVGFQQAFPRDRCDRTYTFETTETPSSVVTLGGACLVTISPRIGLAIGLGVGGESRKRSRRKRSGDAPPAVRGSTAPAPPPPPPASTPPLAPTPLDPHETGSETEPPDRAPDPTRPEPAAPAVDETGSVSPTAPPDTDATTTPPPIDPEATGGASAPPPSEPASPSLEAEMPAPDATVDPEVGAPAPRSARSAPRRHLADAAAQSTAAGP